MSWRLLWPLELNCPWICVGIFGQKGILLNWLIWYFLNEDGLPTSFCTEVRHRHSDSGGLSPQLAAGPFWENGLWPTSGWLALSSSNSSCPNHNFFFSLLPFTSSFQTAFRLGSPFLVMFHQAPCYPNKKPREPLDTPPSFTSCTRSVTRLKHLPNTS